MWLEEKRDGLDELGWMCSMKTKQTANRADSEGSAIGEILCKKGAHLSRMNLVSSESDSTWMASEERASCSTADDDGADDSTTAGAGLMVGGISVT